MTLVERLKQSIDGAELTCRALSAEESKRYRLHLAARARYEAASDAYAVAADTLVSLKSALRIAERGEL